MAQRARALAGRTEDLGLFLEPTGREQTSTNCSHMYAVTHAPTLIHTMTFLI